MLAATVFSLVDFTVTLISFVQPANADDPILVTFFGMVTLVSFVQFLKVLVPTSVTFTGILTLVRFLLPANAPSSIFVTL